MFRICKGPQQTWWWQQVDAAHIMFRLATFLLNWECKLKGLRSLGWRNACDVAPMHLHEASVTLCCDIASTLILCQFVFEQISSIGMKSYCSTSNRYTAIFQNNVFIELHQRNIVNCIVWMRYDVYPDVDACVRQALQHHFGDKVISWICSFLTNAIHRPHSYEFPERGYMR